MKNRKRNTSYAKKFQKWQKNLGPARSTLLILVIIIGALIGVKQVQVHRERTTYRAAERQVETLVENASKFAPSSKEVRKYCSYSSEKYSKGYLSCTVSGLVTYNLLKVDQNDVVSKIIKQKEGLPWVYQYENMSIVGEENNQIAVYVYSFKSLTCALDYGYKSIDGTSVRYDKNKLDVEYRCYGEALKEYY